MPKPLIPLLEKTWIVQADPEHVGKHPYHDARFITTMEYDFEDPRWNGGSIICRMTDFTHQRPVADAISELPNLLRLLGEFVYRYETLKETNGASHFMDLSQTFTAMHWVAGGLENLSIETQQTLGRLGINPLIPS